MFKHNLGRLHEPLSTREFSVGPYLPELVQAIDLDINRNQKVLRMLVESPYSRGLKVPEELQWVMPCIKLSYFWNKCVLKVNYPYTYVTIRSGIVDTHEDDKWHVDGFSMRYPHLPEVNYVWSDSIGTEVLNQCISVPYAFDPMQHNIHTFFQRRADVTRSYHLEEKTLYCLSPYVIQRRPPKTTGTQRTFIRISYTHLEIPDINNTVNPLINTSHYTEDRVRDFRDKLLDFDTTQEG